MITKSYTVTFTRTHTTGTLKDVSFNDEVRFGTRRDATSWIKRRMVRSAKAWLGVKVTDVQLITTTTEAIKTD